MKTGTGSKVSIKYPLNTGTGILTMWNWSNCCWEIWIFHQMFYFWSNRNCFHSKKITIDRSVVFSFLPNYRNTKCKGFFPFCPSQQSWVLISASNMRSSSFILLSKLNFKVFVIHFLNEISDFQCIFFYSKIPQM